MTVSIVDIRAAHTRIAPYVHRTPVFTNRHLNALVGASLFFKCENFQKVGAFKARGAFNALLSQNVADTVGGVVTHSSGNHAAALSFAANTLGIPAHIVMPSNAPKAKSLAVASYGGHIIECAPTLAARETTAQEVLAQTNGLFVHPYDNYDIIAGQGTAAIELHEDVDDLDVVMCPVGGGGLLAGTAVATRTVRPSARIIAAEPLGADDAYRSFQTGAIVPQTAPNTIADGLRTSLGERNFPIIMANVDDIWRVDDVKIIEAMRLIWQLMKIVVEPSAAVTLAALLADPAPVRGRRIGIILSGGNVDLDWLPWQTERAELWAFQ